MEKTLRDIKKLQRANKKANAIYKRRVDKSYKEITREFQFIYKHKFIAIFFILLLIISSF